MPSTLFTILDGVLLGFVVHSTIAIAARGFTCRARFGLLDAVPAGVAEPVCCGPPLL